MNKETKNDLIKYVMNKADKEYRDDFPIEKIKDWIDEFFEQDQQKFINFSPSIYFRNDLKEKP